MPLIIRSAASFHPCDAASFPLKVSATPGSPCPGRRTWARCRESPQTGDGVLTVGTRRNPNTAYLRGQRVRQVVAIQVQRRYYTVFLGPGQYLLQHGVCDDVLDDNFLPLLGFLIATQGRRQQFATEFLLRQFIAPVTESTLGELHDVAFVDQVTDGRSWSMAY